MRLEICGSRVCCNSKFGGGGERVCMIAAVWTHQGERRENAFAAEQQRSSIDPLFSPSYCPVYLIRRLLNPLTPKECVLCILTPDFDKLNGHVPANLAVAVPHDLTQSSMQKLPLRNSEVQIQGVNCFGQDL